MIVVQWMREPLVTELYGTRTVAQNIVTMVTNSNDYITCSGVAIAETACSIVKMKSAAPGGSTTTRFIQQAFVMTAFRRMRINNLVLTLYPL